MATARKKAAAKAAPKQAPQVEALDVDEVEPPGETVEEWPGKLGPYPLTDERHYFYIESTSPFIHSGVNGEDQSAIRAIQAFVGAEETGVYDIQTVSAVVAWRENNGAQDGGTYVDADLWKRMDESVDQTEG